jgi:phosphoglycerol transferase MdoB-like AlkP superfamily enzyme
MSLNLFSDNNLFHIRMAGICLGFLLAIYMLFRIGFILLFNDILDVTGIVEWITILLAGIRFDLSALIYVNAPFLFFALLPIAYRNRIIYVYLLRVVFVIPNVLFILLSIVDMGYYRHTQKRTSAELFGMLHDLLPQLSSYLTGYWYLLIVFILIIWAYIIISNKLINKPSDPRHRPVQQLILFAMGAGLMILLARGGTQLKPISPINAADYVPMRKSAAVLNTPFVFLNSLFKKQLNYVHYMSDATSERIANVIKPSHPYTEHTRKNLVVFILESFNREWIGYLNQRTYYTKFIDSLCTKSIVCHNSYANAKHSNEGIAAILASIPSLMDESIISSGYQDNTLQGLGHAMKQAGYRTSFFHGARNGSFNFDVFSKSCGFDSYYGMNEFNDDTHFDGQWGIWDHVFLKYFADQLDTVNQPFCSVFFNLSSHYPYSLPDSYKKRFMDEPNVNHLPRTIQYVDTCLQQFFESNYNKPWFQNTIFVFCADHTGEGNQAEYKTPLGIFRIPLIIYDPSNPVGISIHKPVMQIDIFPSLMDYLKIPVKTLSFGHSIFDEKSYPAYQFHENYYQMCNDSMFTVFNGEQVIALYNYHKDPLLQNNLINTSASPADELNYLKATIQVFQKRMIDNKLIPN